MICCGDLFDRGSENYEVLKFFERPYRKVLIKGNHEERLAEIFDTGLLEDHDFINGTLGTVLEFLGKYSVIDPREPIDFSGRRGIVERLTELIGQMRDFYETEHYIFVHGWLPNRV